MSQHARRTHGHGDRVLIFPWFRTESANPVPTYTVVAEHLHVSSWPAGLRALVWAYRVHRRLRAFPGLRAHRFAMDIRNRALWTVSAWSTRSALVTFERSEWHHDAARKAISPHLRSSTFAVWDRDASLPPVSWLEIRHRIGEASRRAER